MHGDVALDAKARKAVMPNTVLEGDANPLVMPTLDAANIAYNLLEPRPPARTSRLDPSCWVRTRRCMSDAEHDGAAHRQHDGTGRGRRGRSRSASSFRFRPTGLRGPCPRRAQTHERSARQPGALPIPAARRSPVHRPRSPLRG